MATNPKLVLVMRHAEKPDDAADPNLSPTGQERAKRLANYSGDFAKDNRVGGDGALFIRFSGGEMIALFVRFDTQSTSTDDQGNPTS